MLLGEQKITLYVEIAIVWFEASGAESHQKHRIELIRLPSRSINTDIRILLCLRSAPTPKKRRVIPLNKFILRPPDKRSRQRPHAEAKINSRLLVPVILLTDAGYLEDKSHRRSTRSVLQHIWLAGSGKSFVLPLVWPDLSPQSRPPSPPNVRYSRRADPSNIWLHAWTADWVLHTYTYLWATNVSGKQKPLKSLIGIGGGVKEETEEVLRCGFLLGFSCMMREEWI